MPSAVVLREAACIARREAAGLSVDGPRPLARAAADPGAPPSRAPARAV